MKGSVPLFYRFFLQYAISKPYFASPVGMSPNQAQMLRAPRFNGHWVCKLQVQPTMNHHNQPHSTNNTHSANPEWKEGQAMGHTGGGGEPEPESRALHGVGVPAPGHQALI